MSYSRVSTPYPNFGGTIRQQGYTYKLCPYSTQYRDKYTYPEGYIYGFDLDNNPLRTTGVVVVGNTTNENLQNINYTAYQCSDHTTSSGRMDYVSHPPGWICKDPNCYYAVSIANGACYIES